MNTHHSNQRKLDRKKISQNGRTIHLDAECFETLLHNCSFLQRIHSESVISCRATRSCTHTLQELALRHHGARKKTLKDPSGFDVEDLVCYVMFARDLDMESRNLVSSRVAVKA